MATKCPLFNNEKIVCRVKEESQHRWVGTERAWYIRNYCEGDYHVDCQDYEAYLEQQAITKGKILMVDDEPALLDTLTSFFDNRGYQVITATSAESALKLIKEEPPALALIDIKLPGIDGIELLKIVKKEHPLIKTFVITAYDEENKKTVEEIGCDAFFAKPIGLDQLKRKIIDVLAAKQRDVKKVVKSSVLEGAPKARLLFVLEVLPNEEDRLTPYLRECFGDRSRCGGNYEVDFAYSINDTLDRLMQFRPDIVLINFDSLYQILCGQLSARILESPYRPKEIVVYGLNLEATDKESIEQMGIQYVDQRRSFAKLITTVKQTALRVHQIREGAPAPESSEEAKESSQS